MQSTSYPPENIAVTGSTKLGTLTFSNEIGFSQAECSYSAYHCEKSSILMT
jgi:hypothetical protein